MQPQHFQWSVDGALGRVVLNRPERKNPLTFESYAELRDLFRSLASPHPNPPPRAGEGTERPIRTIVISGAGDNFCSGGDVHDIIGPLTTMNTTGLLAFTRMTGDLVKAMRACPQTIVAAVDGVCAGAGAIIAMVSDLRVGTARSRTSFLFNRVGLAGCDMGACAILPRIIGQGRAAELLYLGRSMSGEEALQWGFFNRLVAPEQLAEAATQLAREIAAGPSFANGITKTMLNQEWSMSLEQAIEAEAQAQALCMHTEDFRRAYRAFLAKQKPTFEGN
jgi:enoyl-CoA hydratase/carnithine racemase